MGQNCTRVGIKCLQIVPPSKKGSKKGLKRGGGVSIYKYHKIYSKKIKVKISGYIFTRIFFYNTAGEVRVGTKCLPPLKG